METHSPIFREKGIVQFLFLLKILLFRWKILHFDIIVEFYIFTKKSLHNFKKILYNVIKDNYAQHIYDILRKIFEFLHTANENLTLKRRYFERVISIYHEKNRLLLWDLGNNALTYFQVIACIAVASEC